eukprot:1150826-Pelagomonas_calceolata.AAC.3
MEQVLLFEASVVFNDCDLRHPAKRYSQSELFETVIKEQETVFSGQIILRLYESPAQVKRQVPIKLAHLCVKLTVPHKVSRSSGLCVRARLRFSATSLLASWSVELPQDRCLLSS